MRRTKPPRYTPPRPESPRTSSASNNSGFDLNYLTMAILGGIFILGIGIGIVFSSATNFTPESIHSSIEIDQQAPNPELCRDFGASAIVTNMRVFVTLDPFNVFISQPSMRPGCVLRRNNWSILERQNLVTSEQVRDCKNRMNTFGYTGALESDPKVSCIYQNDAAGNLFLNTPGAPGARPESDSF